MHCIACIYLQAPHFCHLLTKWGFLGCLESKPLSLLLSWALNFLPFRFSLCHLHLPQFLLCLTFSSEWRCASPTPVTCPWPVMLCAHLQSSRWCGFFHSRILIFTIESPFFLNIRKHMFEFRIFVDSPNLDTHVSLGIMWSAIWNIIIAPGA